MAESMSHQQSKHTCNDHGDTQQFVSDATTSVDELKGLVEKFVSDRDWHKYHTPKNIAISVVLEASELLEHFQWSPPASEEIDADKHRQIAEEMCDVMAYLLSLANILKIDIASSMAGKMQKNCKKYPTQDYQGNWKKPELPR